MLRTSLIALALLAATPPAVAQDNEPPALWTGDSGITTIANSFRAYSGERRRADIILEVRQAYARTGRLATEYVDGALRMPAGTPLYATRYTYIVAAGATDLPTDRTNQWCAVPATGGFVCFKWEAPNRIRRNLTYVGTGAPSLRSPLGDSGFVAAPDIMEGPVEIAGPLSRFYTLRDFSEDGVIVSDTRREGEQDWSFDRPLVPWDTPTLTYFLGARTMSFTPMRDAHGAIVAARVVFSAD